MIALVRIALRRPYTFVVLALVILIIGPLAALRTPVDIFPDIRIPVIAIVWQYTGLQPQDMAGRITTQSQRALTTTVNDIEHIEANSYNGLGIIKVFFQPGADIRLANAQITAICADSAQANAAEYDAAADPQLRCVDRSDHPARTVGLRLVGAGARRYRAEHVAHAAGHDPRRRDSAAVRRQIAPGADRPRSTARCRPVAFPDRMSQTRSPRKT